MSQDVELVRRLFNAVEDRDLEALLDCYDAAIEIHEADSLPYGGVYRGHEGARAHAAAWLEGRRIRHPRGQDRALADVPRRFGSRRTLPEGGGSAVNDG